ncbi:UNVERIFIED_CONTAM: hypothetical protein Sangu_0109100 [Sesamum angustifolium]|uniref:Uncharacterized protein n=1 Tax=Sesamum angustifolium TaxID=2727405 RepID=A0AAW2RLX4_9LAMI
MYLATAGNVLFCLCGWLLQGKYSHVSLYFLFLFSLPANTAVLSLLTVMGFASVLSLLSIPANTVLHLQGKEKDAEDLIVDSIRILEAGGRGESFLCLRRMQYLAQMYIKSNRFAEAEILLRKILHMMELSKGWKSFDTVVAAERLALVLQTAGKLREAEELLERCLGARKKLLPDEHIQNAANMLYTARVKMQISNQLMRRESSRAMAELDMAKDLLHKCVRVARHVLAQVVEQKGNKGPTGIPRKTGNDAHSAALILLQSLNALGSLEIMKLEFPGARRNGQEQGL